MYINKLIERKYLVSEPLFCPTLTHLPFYRCKNFIRKKLFLVFVIDSALLHLDSELSCTSKVLVNVLMGIFKIKKTCSLFLIMSYCMVMYYGIMCFV